MLARTSSDVSSIIIAATLVVALPVQALNTDPTRSEPGDRGVFSFPIHNYPVRFKCDAI